MYSELREATTEDTIWGLAIIQVAVYIIRTHEGARKAMKRENRGGGKAELLAMAKFTGIKGRAEDVKSTQMGRKSYGGRFYFQIREYGRLYS